MSRARSSLAVLAWGVGLVTIGFFAGYGFQSRAASRPLATPTPTQPPLAPLVKGMRLSPDGRWLAFTGVFDQTSRAGVFVVSPKTGAQKFAPSPAGWQDYVAQWRSDSRSLVLEREKIPRAAAEANAGIYEMPLDPATGTGGEPRDITPELPDGEKIIASFLLPDGSLGLRTKSEPKGLFRVQGEEAVRVDEAGRKLLQHRPVKVGNQTEFLIVRDAPGGDGSLALYRVQNGQSRQISPNWNDVSWTYVAPSGRSLILARSIGDDWEWTLFDIETNSAKERKTATIPGDVIAVYWSPDEKTVLGVAGEKIWKIAVPSLEADAIGTRADWNADDAAWLDEGKFAAIAAAGELWRVNVESGTAEKFWRFPAQFWK